jgi:hypothetical protein
MIDTATAEKFLYLGIAVLIAAIAGGGLNAAGILNIPTLRSWKVQAAVGAIGIATMVFAVLAFEQASQTAARADWEKQMIALENAVVGIPPPPYPPDLVRVHLVNLVVLAGDDQIENCDIATFVAEYANRLDTIPDQVISRMRNPSQTSAGQECYAEVERAAEVIQTKSSSTAGAAATKTVGARTGYRRVEAPMIAAIDAAAVSTIVEILNASPDAVADQSSSAARILESLTASGDQGYVYLGSSGSDLGPNRTVLESTVRANGSATIKTAVNLRKIDTDMNLRSHDVYRVLVPGTKIAIESLIPSAGGYMWARVRVTSVPPSS